VIRLRHVPLPRGLSALVRRDDSGALEVFVSQALSPDRQRSAVRVALRSARQAGWRTRLAPGLLMPVPLMPVPLAAVSSVRTWLRAVGTTLRAHALATAGAATAGLAVATSAVLIAVVPHHHAPSTAGRPPVPGRVQAPAPSPATVSRQPRASASTPAAGVKPAGQRPASTAPSRAAQPTASASAPAPSTATSPGSAPSTAPSPSPSPSGGSSPDCLVLLGVWVCL
jgi:hypothetical protein